MTDRTLVERLEEAAECGAELRKSLLVSLLREAANALRAQAGVQGGECDCPGNDKSNPMLHAPNCPVRVQDDAGTQWKRWMDTLRELIGDRAEVLNLAAEVQAEGEGVRFSNVRFVHRANDAAQGAVAFVPGVMHCAKCKFRLVRTNLYMQDGTTGAGDNKAEPCPNGCGPLWPVTWEQEARECWERLEEMATHPQAAPALESPSLKQIVPDRERGPESDPDTGADRGSCCAHAYADGWNDCVGEVEKRVTVAAQATPDTTAAELLGLADELQDTESAKLYGWPRWMTMCADKLRTLAGKIKESGT